MRMKWICLFFIIAALIACVDKETKIKEESIKKLEASLETIPTTDSEARCVVIKKLFIIDPSNKTHSREKNICDRLAIEKEKEKAAQAIENEKEEARQEYNKITGQMNSLVKRWLDASKLANNTSRIALANPISNLQEIKRETEALVVKECLQEAKGKLVSGMNMVIDGYIAFMGNDKESMPAKTIIKGQDIMYESIAIASTCRPQ